MEANKQAGIQVARAIAALCILYFHSWVVLVRFPKGSAYQIPIWTQYGFLAVNLFFAISGYVICLVVTRAEFQPVSFLIKRAFRLYPLWIVTLTAFAVTALMWRAPIQTETLRYFLYSATLLPTQALPFYDVGWSLQHEIAFYALTAIIVPLGGVPALIAFLVATTVAVHTIALPWYFSALALHHSEFLAGVLAFLLAPRLARLGAMLPLALGCALLVLLVAFAGVNFLAPALFLIVVGFANMQRAPQSILAVGDASYSLYLIHHVPFLIVSAVVSKLPWQPWWLAEPLRYVSMAAIIGVALLSYRYLERPTIRLGSKVAARWQPELAVA